MGEFDVSLIREFRCRPAFYDRNSPRFKDKVYTAHEWQEISNKLGYDVSLLKDRMLQLRNRYNLEKRRLEQLREENPEKPVDSPWPLYDQLHFLSDHIRARRSYKRMLPLQSSVVAATAELSNSGSNQSSAAGCGAVNHAAAVVPFANGLLAVKMEDNDSDAESESQSGPEYVGHDQPAMLSEEATFRAHSQAAQDLSLHLPTELPPSITIRRLDTMRQAAEVATSQKLAQKRAVASSSHHQQQQQYLNSNSSPKVEDTAAKQRCLSARENKYAAFGTFISSSLRELPPQKALLLVEKFTSDLVKVLIQKSDANASMADGANGDSSVKGQ